MTLDQLKAQIAEQLEQADADVAARQAALRTAEIQAAFLRGQLHALNQIVLEERPVYSNGVETT